MERTFYRDYGVMGSDQSAQDNMVTVNPRRQVYQATHRGDGSRLPFMYRSFISFTFGGRPIEDFDLIATITNDRIERDAYASFEDLVSSYNVLDGQYYWGTHYQTNTLQFVLSTDGIDQPTLDDFLHWFQAGATKELILSEHPNRAILARVTNPPQISLLPFEYDTNVIISGIAYPTKTTLYKGDITLEFIMDQPHWYAKENVLGKLMDVTVGGQQKKRYVDYWDDTTKEPPEQVDIFASQDALKILVEDGIPLGSMIHTNMLLGNGAYANVEDDERSCIWSIAEEEIEWIDGVPTGEGARIHGELSEPIYIDRSLTGMGTENGQWWIRTEDGEGLLFDKPIDFVADSRECLPGLYEGIVAGPIVDAEGNGISQLKPNNNGYFYYAGTAPSPTIISFILTPEIGSNFYVSSPSNKYVLNRKTGQPYDTFTIESKNKAELRFTTPNLYTSYNEAIHLFKTYVRTNSSQTWEGLRDLMRENIKHAHVRQWAIKVIDSNKNLNMNSGTQNLVCQQMRQMLFDDNGKIGEAIFTFNSETGEAIGQLKYRTLTSDGSSNSFTLQTEDVGDMLRSNYIIIRDRNYPTADGFITAWENYNDTTKSYSHRIYHDVSQPLGNVQIRFKNMYL